ncbi:MAG: 23S rRNA (adenine(2503)-C(2))-methyltransferase RlmN [Longimicrobiaceae bacterium]
MTLITPAGRPDLVGLEPEPMAELLSAHFAARGQASFRTAQVAGWIFGRDAGGFHEMTDLPLSERKALEGAFGFTAPASERVSRSSDGTVKQLWKLAKGELIESVLIPARDRLTLCLSSQAGCALACTFCATGWLGYQRQLTAGEIVAQYRGARRWAREHGYGEISHLVFMGMGEPLVNRKAVMPALSILNRGHSLGARRITVSTVGIVPGILELAGRPEQYRLAVSLHAPNHELRQELIPVEKKYPLPELLEALRVFERAGGRRVTFEYVMISGVNDAPELADELALLVAEFRAHVNLIPYNPIPGRSWSASPPERLRDFRIRLEERGVPASVRRPRGRDISAACGQLKAEYEAKPHSPLGWGDQSAPRITVTSR